jgi:hypothetical protein
MRAHAAHADDCELGPRRRWGRAPRLVRWRKVALNPVFAPS